MKPNLHEETLEKWEVNSSVFWDGLLNGIQFTNFMNCIMKQILLATIFSGWLLIRFYNFLKFWKWPNRTKAGNSLTFYLFPKQHFLGMFVGMFLGRIDFHFPFLLFSNTQKDCASKNSISCDRETNLQVTVMGFNFQLP